MPTNRHELLIWFDQQKPDIQQLFDGREFKEAIKPMTEAVHAFKVLLYELNQTNDLTKDMDSLSIKPINIKERFEYVEGNLKQYHAYLQLITLYEEVEKLYAKEAIKEAMKNQSS
ncbi:MAG: YpoC family protein [Bacillota bacterium]